MNRVLIAAAVVLVLVGLLAGTVSCMVSMPGRSFQGPLPPVTPQDQDLAAALRRHVGALAAEVGPRSLYRDTLDPTLEYISRSIRELGLEPALHTFPVSGTPVSNVEVEIKGAALPEEIVLVGAHYDSVDETPGADDNASGVAVGLELLEIVARHRPRRTVRFVWFANEEPPHFQTKHMGSLAYAERSRARAERIVAMLSIESVGYFSDVEGSQSYPPPFGLLYPSRGDFIAFVGDTGSRALVRSAITEFRRSAQVPSEGLSAPMIIPGVGWSDHWAFAVNDYPAVMVTDTAPFRNPHYHEPTDTPDTLDYRRMALVVRGLGHVIAMLADRS